LQQKQTTGWWYEIRVEGELGEVWSDWFSGLEIHQDIDGGTLVPVTVLSGWMPDQPALHGMLAGIRDLNLTLISVKRLKHDIRRKK
jgi:hypothetical protein